MKIFIVEDEREIRRELSILLRKYGYSFESSTDLDCADSENIPRIFDKGFTGENGRKYKKSTGIGLYLSRKLCRKMNMEISAASCLQSGTTLKIIFPKENLTFR